MKLMISTGVDTVCQRTPIMSSDETGIPILVKTLATAVKLLAWFALSLMLVIAVLVVYIAQGQ